MISRRKSVRSIATTTTFCFLLLGGSLLACQVPVFRYALEQWNPGAYKLVIVTSESEAERSKYQEWIKAVNDQTATDVQFEISTPNKYPWTKDLWNRRSEADKPLLVALYPPQTRIIGGEIAHVTSLSRETLKQVVDSPVRRDVAARLSHGDSAVWLLLRCGDNEKDRIARESLQRQLTIESSRIPLPTAEAMEIEPQVLEQVKVKLKINFSLIEVDRNDPKEKFLIDALLNSEEDLRSFDEPIAFPVFGRGLVLYALVGKGISTETIQSATSFICGPCSCQVKEQNPGFDLLMQQDWQKLVGDIKISQPLNPKNSAVEYVPIPSGRSKHER